MIENIFKVLQGILPVCEFEDSTNCYWIGGINEAGYWFVDILGVVLLFPMP